MKYQSSYAACVWALTLASLPAVTVYQENFVGGNSTLQGQTPDTTSNFGGGTSGATWTSSSNWSDTGVKSANADSNAFLPFTPQNGLVYTLSMGMDITNVTNSYFALGFTNATNTGIPFANAPLNASPWGLLRGDQTLFSPASELVTFRGTNATGRNDIPTSFLNPAGEGIFSIVLDTTSTFWKASWFFTLPASSPTQLGSTFTYTTNPTISHVGFGGRGNAVGTVSSFSLVAVPEPTSALAGILLGAGLLRRKRRP